MKVEILAVYAFGRDGEDLSVACKRKGCSQRDQSGAARQHRKGRTGSKTLPESEASHRASAWYISMARFHALGKGDEANPRDAFHGGKTILRHLFGATYF